MLSLYSRCRGIVLAVDSVCCPRLTHHFTGLDRSSDSSEAAKLVDKSQPESRTLDFLDVHLVTLSLSPGGADGKHFYCML